MDHGQAAADRRRGDRRRCSRDAGQRRCGRTPSGRGSGAAAGQHAGGRRGVRLVLVCLIGLSAVLDSAECFVTRGVAVVQAWDAALDDSAAADWGVGPAAGCGRHPSRRPRRLPQGGGQGRGDDARMWPALAAARSDRAGGVRSRSLRRLTALRGRDLRPPRHRHPVERRRHGADPGHRPRPARRRPGV